MLSLCHMIIIYLIDNDVCKVLYNYSIKCSLSYVSGTGCFGIGGCAMQLHRNSISNAAEIVELICLCCVRV